jgi:hypothetical protein
VAAGKDNICEVGCARGGPMNRLKVAENINLDFVGKLWENHDFG